MSLAYKKRYIVAKIESSYGVDAVPTGAANAMQVSNLEPPTFEGKTVSRDLVRPYFGNSENLPGNVYQKITFGIEIAGAGAAGTVPAYGPLLRACAFSETISAGVSVVYAPVSSALESITIVYNNDGVNHKLLGCRGTVSLDFSESGIPMFKFDFTGVYGGITDVAASSLTLTAFQKPLPVNRTNTPTFTLHSYAAIVEKLSIDMANTVSFRSLIGGAESVQLTDRKPAGSISMEATTVAAKDWWTTVKNATTASMQLVHGITAGNIVQIDAPKVQITSPKYADKDGVTMLSAALVLVPNASNDEFTLTVK